MSIRSLSYLAIQRDIAEPNTQAGGGGGMAAAPHTAAAPQIPQSFVDVLTSAIPTEPLVAYTAILGFIAGTIDSTKPREYLPLRWIIYGAFLVLIVGAVAVTYIRGASPVKKRAFPVTEGLAALIAGAAWGLAMPGSALNAQLTGTLRAITSATIAIGAAAVLAIVFVPPLKTGTNATPVANEVTGRAATAHATAAADSKEPADV